MGITELIFLDYRDSGMVGTQENLDQRAYINVLDAEVIDRLVAIIRRLRPQVIATFEPNGGYGHPDHIAVHRHTVAAFHAAADPNFHPELGQYWQTSRLFYTAIPRSFFIEMRRRLEEFGEDTSEFDRFDDPAAGWPDDQVHVHLDVASTVNSKWEALNCHRTQFGPGNLFRKLPEEQVKDLISMEFFALAWPEPEPGLQLDGLFAGLA